MTDTAVRRPIHHLSTELANQIAAGEVIERPASVIKELLENSIDAGAEQLDIELERGGITLIRVRDDGHGIPADELPLATAPHATSKLYDLSELIAIHSLGFRGEALASIASVSSLTLTSSVDESGHGHTLPPGGESVRPAPHRRGTTIEMRDLFYNIPARRKFLRTERTEYLHIEEVVKRIALANPTVGFTLKHNGREQLRLKGAGDERSVGERIARLLGRRFQQSALPVAFEAAGMRLSGWVAPADASRSQADLQYFYLNGRTIRDRLVNHALRAAYGERVEPGRYPAWLLYMEMAAESVDINVHPTKHEVRFHETRMVHDFLSRGLNRTLGEETVPTGTAVASGYPATSLQPHSVRRVADEAPRQAALYRHAASQGPVVDAPSSDQDGTLGRPISVVDRRLILCQSERGVVLVDRLGALRKFAYRSLSRALTRGEVRSRPLLIPVTLELAPDACEAIERQASRLGRFGLVIERLGESTVVVRELPLALDGIGLERLLQAIDGPLGSDDDEVLLRAMVEALTLDSEPPTLSVDEMSQLLRQLGGDDNGGIDGRPLWRELAADDLLALLGDNGATS